MVAYTYGVAVIWDPKKPPSTYASTAFSFAEAATVFADPLALAAEDSVDPGRSLMIGFSDRRRLVLTVYAEIDDDTIRIVSARLITSHERRHYEEAT